MLRTFYCNPFRECTYLLSDSEGRTLVVDCGASDEAEWLRQENYIKDRHLTVCAHLLTHAHLDHIFGVRRVYESYGVRPYLHPADAFLYRRLAAQAAAFGLPWDDMPLPDFLPLPEAPFRIASFGITALHTPGHTPGGVCYRIDSTDDEPTGDSAASGIATTDFPLLFTGDTLFQGGFGRTDLPGGDFPALMQSLRSLAALPDMPVYPGHGYPTRIAQEHFF